MSTYKDLYPGCNASLDRRCLYYAGVVERMLLEKKQHSEELIPKGLETSDEELRMIIKYVLATFDLSALLGDKLLADCIGKGSQIIMLKREIIDAFNEFANGP